MYQVLKTCTLPVLQAYLDADIETSAMPDKNSVKTIAKAVERLRFPHFAAWIGLFRVLAEHARKEKVGIEPILPLSQAVEC